MTDTVSSTESRPAHLTRTAALETVAATAALLFNNGQTTERVVVAAERLGHALGVPLTLHPHWGELALQVKGAPFSEMVPVTPIGVDMGKVLAVMTVVDQVCDGALPREDAGPALEAAGRLPPASTPRFALFAAIGAASLGVL
ncbi:MAG TPA: threonine/serine exporter family protein, partial [Opitutaceae bacterium]|nr:threonine/serine exporter family protein [Opitutaceae bacterium]